MVLSVRFCCHYFVGTVMTVRVTRWSRTMQSARPSSFTRRRKSPSSRARPTMKSAIPGVQSAKSNFELFNIMKLIGSSWHDSISSWYGSLVQLVRGMIQFLAQWNSEIHRQFARVHYSWLLKFVWFNYGIKICVDCAVQIQCEFTICVGISTCGRMWLQIQKVQ